MTDMTTGRVDINRLLVEMRSMKNHTQAFNRPQSVGDDMGIQRPQSLAAPGVTDSKNVSSFGDVMTKAIDAVNDTQKATGELRTAYDMGDPNVGITDVMVAAQKSSVSFQAMVQVRNKLVEAYRDVMNMPI